MTDHGKDAPNVTFDSFIGQERTKRLLAVEINLALADTRPLGHVLLCGPPGAGKTAIARAVAHELGDPLLVIARPLRRREELVELLTNLGAGVVFVDEIHTWPNSQQDALLTLLEEGYIDDPDFGQVTFPWLTVIAATTEREMVGKALRSRFGLQPLFEPYTEDDMANIVEQMADRAGVEMDWQLCSDLGRASGGVPRQARHLVDRVRALAATGEPVTLEEILDLANVEHDGLTTEHVQLLGFLVEMGGQAGLTTLANRMRLHEREIVDLERLLLERHYVRYGTRGRLITTAGRQRIKARLNSS